MEPRAGAPHGAGRLRPLNEPRPVAVRANAAGTPLAVRGEAVAVVEETWRIDEGWWRERAVSRRYWRLTLAGGRAVTVYQDLLTGDWYEQRY